jgi:hypothetical protein
MDRYLLHSFCLFIQLAERFYRNQIQIAGYILRFLPMMAQKPFAANPANITQ